MMNQQKYTQEDLDRELLICSSTPAVIACSTLIEMGANIFAKGAEDRTPFHCSASKGRSEVLKMLLDHCQDISLVMTEESFTKMTPLHLAASKGEIKTVKVLLDKGADIDVQSSQGTKDTPLDSAIFYNNMGNALYLVAMGANTECAKAIGSTKFKDMTRRQAALRLGDQELLQEIIFKHEPQGDVDELDQLIKQAKSLKKNELVPFLKSLEAKSKINRMLKSEKSPSP